ncbi:unnamed protein product [Diatraea saccharalis]|uniref:MADF domain-containing protein n=1 Tax=Diatraea saccharalis TaxID=40085 RepID=A0A9N9REY0_9NEOP|nr:unnamed protein product [Diatraea saccharalis]
MNDADLIYIVRNYEELYNVHHQNYSNQQRRDNIWDEIGEQLCINGKICRARWHKLRENYRKALILRKTKSDQGASKIKPPKYYRELSFLTPYFNDDEITRFNIPDVSHTSNIRTSEHEGSPDYTNDSPGGGGDSQNSDSSLSNRTSNSQRRKTKSLRVPPPPIRQTTAAAVLKDYLSRTTQRRNPETDTLIDFFVTMAKTVAKFPVHKQLKIKSQLFKMVHDEEIAEANAVRAALY